MLTAEEKVAAKSTDFVSYYDGEEWIVLWGIHKDGVEYL